MPRPALRTTSFRRIKKRLPGGRSTIHYKKKGPKGASCATCKGKLHGVPRGLPYEINKLPKTKKRPERPFGGHLCSSCSREAIKSQLYLR